MVLFFILLQVAAKTLPFYKDYFNVPYPLPKIDLIAIADFAAGKVNFTLLINCNYFYFEFYDFQEGVCININKCLYFIL